MVTEPHATRPNPRTPCDPLKPTSWMKPRTGEPHGSTPWDANLMDRPPEGVRHHRLCSRPKLLLRTSWTGEPEVFCPACGRHATATTDPAVEAAS